MNLKSVLRVYTLLRQLTDDEAALLATLRALTDSERELLVEAVSEGKVTKRPTATRKIEHCAACDYTKRAAVHKDASADGYHEFQSSQGKSARAVKLADAIKKSTGSREQSLCSYVHPEEGGLCNWAEYALIHDPKGGYAGYHPFQPATTAPSAAQPSSASSGEQSGTASSATQPDGVSDAVHAASGGGSGE